MKIRYTYKVTVTTDEESGADNEKALQKAADAIDASGNVDVCEHNAEEVEDEVDPELDGDDDEVPPADTVANEG